MTNDGVRAALARVAGLLDICEAEGLEVLSVQIHGGTVAVNTAGNPEDWTIERTVGPWRVYHGSAYDCARTHTHRRTNGDEILCVELGHQASVMGVAR